jgi:hypothetical protein
MTIDGWSAVRIVPQKSLHESQFERGLDYVVGLLENPQAGALEWGAATHALHGLRTYEERALDGQPGRRREHWIRQK